MGPATATGGFTLMELLVVMGIILLLMALVTPVFKTDALDQGIAGVAGTLEQARAYAMANNTYVFVGIAEVDAAQSTSAKPQKYGVGRLVIAAVASKDGTKHFATTDKDQGLDWQTSYKAGGKPESNGAHLVQLNNVQRFENLHLAEGLNGFGAKPPTTGNMNRPYQPSNNYIFGSSTCESQTPFTLPLGTTLSDSDASGDQQYLFKKVVQFDPQGVARITTPTNSDTIVQQMEIGLQPTRGAQKPTPPTDQNKGNQAAIQIDAMTGAVRIYRP